MSGVFCSGSAPVQSFAVCFSWPVTVLNYLSLYIASPGVIIDKEITSVKGENQSQLLHIKHIMSCPAFSGYEEFIILFFLIRMRRITMYFRLSKPDPSNLFMETMFPRSLKTSVVLFWILFQFVHIFPELMYTYRWTQDSRHCVISVFPNMTLLLQCDSVSALGGGIFPIFIFKNWELLPHLVNCYLVFVRAITKSL